jgi:hypothetical protein
MEAIVIYAGTAEVLDDAGYSMAAGYGVVSLDEHGVAQDGGAHVHCNDYTFLQINRIWVPEDQWIAVIAGAIGADHAWVRVPTRVEEGYITELQADNFVLTDAYLVPDARDRGLPNDANGYGHWCRNIFGARLNSQLSTGRVEYLGSMLLFTKMVLFPLRSKPQYYYGMVRMMERSRRMAERINWLWHAELQAHDWQITRLTYEPRNGKELMGDMVPYLQSVTTQLDITRETYPWPNYMVFSLRPGRCDNEDLGAGFDVKGSWTVELGMAKRFDDWDKYVAIEARSRLLTWRRVQVRKTHAVVWQIVVLGARVVTAWWVNRQEYFGAFPMDIGLYTDEGGFGNGRNDSAVTTTLS